MLMGLTLVFLLVGPWTWMDKISNKWSTRCIYLLPVLAFFLTFGRNLELFSTDYTMFSNDGPLGIMHSAWLSEATPGGQIWMDIYWLGGPGAEVPISISYIFLWLCNNPGFIVLAIGLGMFGHNIIIKKFK